MRVFEKLPTNLCNFNLLTSQPGRTDRRKVPRLILLYDPKRPLTLPDRSILILRLLPCLRTSFEANGTLANKY